MKPPYFHLGAQAETAAREEAERQQKLIDQRLAAEYALRNLPEEVDE